MALSRTRHAWAKYAAKGLQALARVVLALPLPSSTAVDRVIGQMRRKDIPIASRSAIAASSFLARQLVRARIRRWSWTRKRKPFNFKAERDNVFTLVPGEYVDGEIFVHGAYEYRLLRLLASNLHGAARRRRRIIGNHALYLANNFDRVICFEPNPPTAARLRENIRLSGKSNVIVHELGLGERDDELPFHHHSGGNAGGGSLSAPTFRSVVPCRSESGDDVLAECGKSPAQGRCRGLRAAGVSGVAENDRAGPTNRRFRIRRARRWHWRLG